MVTGSEVDLRAIGDPSKVTSAFIFFMHIRHPELTLCSMMFSQKLTQNHGGMKAVNRIVEAELMIGK